MLDTTTQAPKAGAGVGRPASHSMMPMGEAQTAYATSFGRFGRGPKPAPLDLKEDWVRQPPHTARPERNKHSRS